MSRYMRKPWRCSLCFRSFDNAKQAEAHWLKEHAETQRAEQ